MALRQCRQGSTLPKRNVARLNLATYYHFLYDCKMGRNIIFAPGEFYHLYNRGTEKRNIFTSQSDYERFLALLYAANGTVQLQLERQGSTLPEIRDLDRGEILVNIAAYCLMPNHFHLLVREKEDNGISRFMQKLITGYTMYFNTRHERTGALLQGRFKATHADSDQYLKYLIAYIHLNPVKLIDPEWKENGIEDRKRADDYLRRYKYSSYLDYLGFERPEQVIISRNALPRYFETHRDFTSNIREWLEYQKP